MRVSVTLLTRNGVQTLPAVLDAIAGQDTGHDVELVAVDSGSTDGSAEMLEGRADKFLSIDPKTFNHGATRNLAIELGSGDAAVLLVQDAVPASPSWLNSLTAPLEDNRRLAATYARQLPRPDAAALTRWNLARWSATEAEARVTQFESPNDLLEMTPMDQLRSCTFDNVCSCVRRSVWQDLPFQTTPIAEDLSWAKDVLLAGHGIAYQPAAQVYHSHERSLGYELDRTTAVHHRLFDLFGVRTIPGPGSLFRSIVTTINEHLQVVANDPGPKHPGDFARAVGLAVVWPLGQYLGGRAALRHESR